MKILITGICGFTGSTLARELAKEGNEVCGLDNFLREGSRGNVEPLRKLGIRVEEGDIRNEADLAKNSSPLSAPPTTFFKPTFPFKNQAKVWQPFRPARAAPPSSPAGPTTGSTACSGRSPVPRSRTARSCPFPASIPKAARDWPHFWNRRRPRLDAPPCARARCGS